MTMISSQNHRTNINTAKASARKLRKVKPSEKNNMGILLGFTWRTFWTPPYRRWSLSPTLGIRLAGKVIGIYQNTGHMRVDANGFAEFIPCCGCRERPAHSSWLVTPCRSWQEVLLSAAAG